VIRAEHVIIEASGLRAGAFEHAVVVGVGRDGVDPPLGRDVLRVPSRRVGVSRQIGAFEDRRRASDLTDVRLATGRFRRLTGAAIHWLSVSNDSAQPRN
jgi:hypothetical protein